ARVYIQKGQVDEGIAILDRMLAGDPENSILLNTLGFAYNEKGDYEEALKIYERVLTRSEYEKNALYNTGIILWKLDRRPEAHAVFLKFYYIYPEEEDLLYNLGFLEFEMDNTENGIKYLEAYVEKHSDDIKSLTAIAEGYVKIKYFGKGLEYYNKILNINPTKPDVLFEKAFILLTAIGDSVEGMKIIEEAVLAGYKNPKRIKELLDNPDLINPDELTRFLEDKDLLPPEETSGEREIDSSVERLPRR
ncbi:MAG: tetratricopeptide repeat protein, partial [Spirochaetota bacterium]